MLQHNGSIEKKRNNDVQLAQREFEEAETEKKDAFTRYYEFKSPSSYRTYEFAVRKYSEKEKKLQDTRRLLNKLQKASKEIRKKLELYQDALKQLNTQQNQMSSGAATAPVDNAPHQSLRF